MNNEFLKIGDNAPDFTLPNYDEKACSLADYKGKKIVIWFFPKASTPGWTVQGEGFRDELKNFKSLGCEIIGVSADPPKRQKKFVEKYQFPFQMLCDESHDMLIAYKAWGLKKFMGKEYMGIFRITYVIDENGKIANVYPKVNTKTHAQDILCDIK